MKAWKNAEERIAELLGGTRIKRVSFRDSQPDFIAKKGGFTFIGESKHGKHIPKFLTDALDQAKQHTKKGEIYIAYFHPKGEHRGIIALEDIHFVEILESRLEKEEQKKLF
jgi:hypothetical protein